MADIKPIHAHPAPQATRRRWTPDEDTAIRNAQAIASYGGLVHLAQQLGRTYPSVQCRAKRIGALRISTIRHDYFDSWSNEMAYVLGYVWADGCIQINKSRAGYTSGRLQLACTESDAYLIRKIAASMGVHREQRTTQMTPGFNTRPQIRIRINSMAIASALSETLGVPRRKSYGDPPLPHIPDEYLPHFMRGVFDGDGTVLVVNGQHGGIGIYGTHRFLSDLALQASRVLSIISPKIAPARSIYHIRWTKQADVLTLFDAFYSDGGICLERKRDKLAALSPVIDRDRGLTRALPVFCRQGKTA